MHTVCNHLPSTMSNDCNNFTDKYGEDIIDLLEQAVQPGEICSLLFFCSTEVDMIKCKHRWSYIYSYYIKVFHISILFSVEVKKCAVCEEVAVVIARLLANPKIDHSIEHILEKTCRALPRNDQNLVNNFTVN